MALRIERGFLVSVKSQSHFPSRPSADGLRGFNFGKSAVVLPDIFFLGRCLPFFRIWWLVQSSDNLSVIGLKGDCQPIISRLTLSYPTMKDSRLLLGRWSGDSRPTSNRWEKLKVVLVIFDSMPINGLIQDLMTFAEILLTTFDFVVSSLGKICGLQVLIFVWSWKVLHMGECFHEI